MFFQIIAPVDGRFQISLRALSGDTNDPNGYEKPLDTILSIYNDDDVCSCCYDAIPLNERPYKYRAL